MILSVRKGVFSLPPSRTLTELMKQPGEAGLVDGTGVHHPIGTNGISARSLRSNNGQCSTCVSVIPCAFASGLSTVKIMTTSYLIPRFCTWINTHRLHGSKCLHKMPPPRRSFTHVHPFIMFWWDLGPPELSWRESSCCVRFVFRTTSNLFLWCLVVELSVDRWGHFTLSLPHHPSKQRHPATKCGSDVTGDAPHIFIDRVMCVLCTACGVVCSACTQRAAVVSLSLPDSTTVLQVSRFANTLSTQISHLYLCLYFFMYF